MKITKETLAIYMERGDSDSMSALYDNISSYLETYYEIVAGIEQSLHLSGSTASLTLETKGTGGLLELAKALTDEFEEKHEDIIWDGDFYDTVEAFLKERL